MPVRARAVAVLLAFASAAVLGARARHADAADALAAADADLSPPADLATRFGQSLLAAAARVNARAVRVELAGDGELEGAPALAAMSRALDATLYAPGKLVPAGGAGATPDLEAVAHLRRVRGRISLDAALTAHGATVDWALASSEETPEWWPWLEPPAHPPASSSGILWRHVGALAQTVEDADAGDLDGDGVAEFAVATASELLVLRVSGAGPEVAATALFDEGPAVDPAAIATRSPRTFVRVITAPGGAGEVWVRRTDEQRTRVYGFEGARLVRRGDRDELALASRRTPRGTDVVTAALADGTNRFEDAPGIRRAANAPAKPLARGAWTDLRPATLTAASLVAGTGPFYGRLDASGTLSLLGADFGELARIPHCGEAFALADLDGDGVADALCAADHPASEDDVLSLFLSRGGATSAAWTSTLDGPMRAVAAGPAAGGPAALAFVEPHDGGTDVYLLRGVGEGLRTSTATTHPRKP